MRKAISHNEKFCCVASASISTSWKAISDTETDVAQPDSTRLRTRAGASAVAHGDSVRGVRGLVTATRNQHISGGESDAPALHLFLGKDSCERHRRMRC